MCRRVLGAGVVLVLVVSTSGSAGAGSDARAAYREVLARERAVRTPGAEPAAVADLRGVVAAYRAIVERFPQSPYAPHALWQAAGLCLAAFEAAHDRVDLADGRALLQELQARYPASPRALRVEARRRRFETLDVSTRLTDIRRDTLAGVTRLTFELDREVPFSRGWLDEPRRLRFELPNTSFASSLTRRAAFGRDAVGGVMTLEHRPDGVTEATIETPPGHTCHLFTLYDPFRIVTDCRAAADPAAASDVSDRAAEAPPPAPPSPAAPATMARQLGLGITRVVIDPGHGGRDPGARGHDLEESVIVLDISHRVARRLERYGIEVVMTRRTDRYVPLDARTMLANRVQADLFLSIHANASPRPAARGVETYVLDFAASPEAAAVATRENETADGTLVELDAFVRAIRTSAKASESQAFADLVQHRLVSKLRSVDPGIPDLGVKRAPFVVLVGARVPSVLVEVSFLSNQQEARLLGTETYRDLIADALVEAVLGYRQVLKPTNSTDVPAVAAVN